MRILEFDTETSGFPERGGRLVQFAARIVDLRFTPELTVQEFSTLVTCPDDIHEGAFAVHGITKEMTQAGIDAQQVCAWLSRRTLDCDLVVAHNAQFDIKVMDYEFKRAGIEEGFKPEHVFCTMLATTNICKLPSMKAGYKWPKLAEALQIICNENLENAHDALADTRACHKVFMELVKLGLVPNVSLKGNQPTNQVEDLM